MQNLCQIRAAQYLRMSTEHQEYSLENQVAVIKRYAEGHGFLVVETCADAGKSGLVLRNRPGLRRSLQHVMGGSPPFEAILVYDVSRWGRFQDIDESAHYEFICRSSGIPVHYCAEPFTNDGSLANMITKALKRMMAGEYSRELSAKVYEGANNLAKLGFWQGGIPGYGFRRLLVSADGRAKGHLLSGQRKSIQEDRVVLVPGPAEETYWIREIFRLFTEERKKPLEIAKELNANRVKYNGVIHRDWHRQAVDRILRNPKYKGANVYGRSSQRLGSPRIKLPQSQWAVTPGCWPAIVDPTTFDCAQQAIANQTVRKSSEQLIADLSAVLKRRGKLSEQLVMDEPNLPSQRTYRTRFGSMSQAFALAGYDNARLLAINLRRQRRTLRERLLMNVAASSGGKVSIFQTNGLWKPQLRVPNGLLVSVYLLPSFKTEHGEVRWLLNAVPRERDLVTFIARLNIANDDFEDYYVLRNLSGRTRWTLTPDDKGLKAGKRLFTTSEFASVVDQIRQ